MRTPPYVVIEHQIGNPANIFEVYGPCATREAAVERANEAGRSYTDCDDDASFAWTTDGGDELVVKTGAGDVKVTIRALV